MKNHLKEIREACGLTQAQLVEVSGQANGRKGNTMEIIKLVTAEINDLHRHYADLISMDADEAKCIINAYQELADNGKISEDAQPSDDPFGFFSFDHVSTVSEALEDIDAAFRKAIERTFFGKISREAMVTMLNALLLAPDGAITVSSGMVYSPLRAMSKWNTIHSEERPISINPDYLP